jgi:hypothetical protein
MSTPRPRGHHSSLICTRCRKRKIKCNLPDSVTAPSTIPQPLNLACQRCRQNGLECIVSNTVLGRPGASRAVNLIRTTPSSDQPIEQNGEPVTKEFLLSQPYDEGMSGHRIGAAEVCEALSNPLRFLSVLLSRHPTFGTDLPGHGDWTGLLDQVILQGAQEVLESRSVRSPSSVVLLMIG